MPIYPINTSQIKRAVISLGGSIVVPEEVNIEYLSKFREFIFSKIKDGWKFVIVVGGGGPARKYINAAKAIVGNDLTPDDLDWLGIHATRFNAHLIRTIFRDVSQPSIVTNPEEDAVDEHFDIIVTAGWKPGWSTDFIAAKMAIRLKAPYLLNLSNIKQVFSADPKKDPNAKPIDEISWKDFSQMVGDTWIPGMNVPFDPIATKLSKENNLSVLVMDGSNIENLESCFSSGKFVGTVIHD